MEYDGFMVRKKINGQMRVVRHERLKKKTRVAPTPIRGLRSLESQGRAYFGCFLPILIHQNCQTHFPQIHHSTPYSNGCLGEAQQILHMEAKKQLCTGIFGALI